LFKGCIRFFIAPPLKYHITALSLQGGLKMPQSLNPENLKLKMQKKSKINSTNDIARMAAPKAAQFFYNIVRVGPRVILRSAFELLRANTITRILSALVLVAIDTISLIRRRISFKQYVINLVLAVMLMVGGTAGWILGSEVLGVFVENVVLSVFAGLVGAGILAMLLSIGWEKLVKLFFKDDTEDMLDICNKVFIDMANEYDLNEEQALEIKDKIKITAQTLQRMFAQKDRHNYARKMFKPYFTIGED